jgi:hypothetical protein
MSLSGDLAIIGHHVRNIFLRPANLDAVVYVTHEDGDANIRCNATNRISVDLPTCLGVLRLTSR